MAQAILVVEDDEELRPLLVSVLEDEGYQVEDAHNGERAVQIAREKFFDLIITDIRMEGMDGLETAEAIHRIQPDVPLIVVTGYAQNDVPTRAVRQGALDYLRKPFQLRQLLKSVEEALNNQAIWDRLDSLTTELQSSQSEKTSEGDRARVMQKFYLAVRSSTLDEWEANRVWENIQKAASQEFRGQGDYSEAETLLDAAMSKWEETSHNDSVSPEFQFFFEQIKEGKVSRHEVRLAHLLRDLDVKRLEEHDPELSNLRQKIWG